jgi:hypothetical protein
VNTTDPKHSGFRPQRRPGGGILGKTSTTWVVEAFAGAHGPRGGLEVLTCGEHNGPNGRAFELSASSTGGGVSANCSKRWGGAYRHGSREFAGHDRHAMITEGDEESGGWMGKLFEVGGEVAGATCGGDVGGPIGGGTQVLQGRIHDVT